MIKDIFLILIIILVTTSAAAAQERTAYRVELLVLRHLDSFSEALPMTELPDLSGLLDLRAQSDRDAPALAEDPFYLGAADSELPPPVGPFPDQRAPWADIVLLEQRSERMNTVWRNLRLSSEFRPEVFLAWEQSAEGPFPELRVHNEEVLWIEDPHAALRISGPAYVFHYVLERGELGMAPIPEPIYHYALDGSVRLRRSRFLHFDLDLAFRSLAPGALPGMSGPPLRGDLGVFEVHRLRQSRQVRTERMEYFDSPVLGALLWVTQIERNTEAIE